MRMTNRRLTRLTNAFSKKLENHGHMVALRFTALQLHQNSQDAANHSGDGCWHLGSCLFDGRDCNASRCRLCSEETRPLTNRSSKDDLDSDWQIRRQTFAVREVHFLWPHTRRGCVLHSPLRSFSYSAACDFQPLISTDAVPKNAFLVSLGGSHIHFCFTDFA